MKMKKVNKEDINPPKEKITSTETDKIADELNSPNPEVLEMAQVPSEFKMYDVSTILFRRLKVKEVKLLSKAGTGSLNFLIKAHQKAVLNMDILDMLPVDFKAMAMVIATHTKPEFSVTISYNCVNPECSNHTAPIVSSLTIGDIDWESLESASIEYKGETHTPIRIRDLLFIEEVGNKVQDILGDEYIDGEFSTVVMALSSDPSIAVNKDIDKFIEAYTRFGNMDFDPDFDTIADKLFPDIKPVKVSCPKCLTAFDINLILDFSKVYL